MMISKTGVKKSSQAGAGLLEAMIALGLMAVVAMGFAKVMKNSMTAQKSVMNDSEFNDIKKTLAGRVNCDVTAAKWAAASPPISPSTCTDTVPLYDGKGNIVVSADSGAPTKFGTWTVRALCQGPASPELPTAAQYGLELQASKPKPGVSSDVLHDDYPADFYPDTFRQGYYFSWHNGARPKVSYLTAASLYPTSARSLCAQNFAYLTSNTVPQQISCVQDVKLMQLEDLTPKNQYGFRLATYDCPQAHPVAMSASYATACSGISASPYSNVQMVNGSYPSQYVCTQQFWEDFPGTSQFTAGKNNCDTVPPATYPPGVTSASQLYGYSLCTAVCCTFPKTN